MALLGPHLEDPVRSKGLGDLGQAIGGHNPMPHGRLGGRAPSPGAAHENSGRLPSAGRYTVPGYALDDA